MKTSFANAQGLVIRIKNWNFRKTFKEAQENAAKAGIEIQKPRQLNKINLIIFKISASARSTVQDAGREGEIPDIRVLKPIRGPSENKIHENPDVRGFMQIPSGKKSARMADFPGFQGESPDWQDADARAEPPH